MNHLRADFDKTPTRKRRLAGDAFIKNSAKRKKVAASIDFLSRSLLRRKIERRADNYVAARAGRRQSFLARIPIKTLVVRNLFDQAKVQHLNLTALRDDHVGRFYVTMYNSPAMSFAKCFGDIGNNPDGLWQRQRSGAKFVV